MRFLWLLVSQFIGNACQGQFANERYTQCLAKRDKSAAMLSLNYFFIVFILIKDSQKIACIMNTFDSE